MIARSSYFCRTRLAEKIKSPVWNKIFVQCRSTTKKAGLVETVTRPPGTKPCPSYVEVERQLGPFSNKPYVSTSSGLFIVLSGPSGVGKDTVVRELQRRPIGEEKEKDFHFIVTATSRAPRDNEVNGHDYHFVSKETFEKWIEEDQLYEYSIVYGDYKGVPKREVTNALDKGLDCILRLDVQGVRTLKKINPRCLSIFLTPYSQEEQVKRLVTRQSESMEALKTRIETAREEMSCMEQDLFDYIVENKDGAIQHTVSNILCILKAERRNRRRLFQNHAKTVIV